VHKLAAAATGYSDDQQRQPQEVLRDGAAAAGAQRQRCCTAGADSSGEKNREMRYTDVETRTENQHTHSASIVDECIHPFALFCFALCHSM
jgi:hypothetical protein